MRICKRTLTAFKDIGNSELNTLPVICMKNHTLDIYGIIYRTSIEDQNYLIIDRNTKEEYKYRTPEALVEAGWMVD